METCCVLPATEPGSPKNCPACGKPGRTVERITLKALLRPEALTRLSAPEHRFCSTAECSVVYFGRAEVFERGDLSVPVFQKEPEGARTVCYCLGITEADVRREIAETGRTTAAERITALVKGGRCACEVKNPQGSCCLGNIAAVTGPSARVVASRRGAGQKRAAPASIIE